MSARPDAVRRMLQPRSIAVVGASARPGSLGERMVTEVLRNPDGPRVHLINPGTRQIAGMTTHADLSELNDAPDLVLLGVADERLVPQLKTAAAMGVGGAVVFGSAHTAGVREELQQIANDAEMALCGAGCMGFVNARDGIRALGYVERDHLPAGPISVVTHSGSVFSALLRTHRALGFDLVVSSGQELVTSTVDYVDHIIASGSTRVLGLVLETVREGHRMIESLRAARDAGIEVVILPMGGSDAGAAMVASHSGAIAGGSATWEALAEVTGAMLVADLAELTDTLELLGMPRRPSRPGGLATVHDSGGERSLLVDLATTLEVPLASLAPDTIESIQRVLDHGLEATNPLDVWGEGKDTRTLFRETLTAMTADPGVASTALAVDLVEEYDGDTAYVDAVLDVAAATDHPLAVLASIPSAIDQAAASQLRQAGVAVLEGTRSGLVALKHLVTASQPPTWQTPEPDADRVARWTGGLLDLDPAEQVALLADYGIPAPAVRMVASAEEAETAAVELGGPVVLKTANPDIAHKSEVGGVIVGVEPGDVAATYTAMAGRLGPMVSVHAIAPRGVELSVGMITDPQLGPLVVIAAGGILVELLGDRAVLVPPLSPDRARAAIDRLSIRPLLGGWRGDPPADIDALIAAIVALGDLATELGDQVDAVEINPLLATPTGATALDVLITPTSTDPTSTDTTSTDLTSNAEEH